MSWFAGYVEFYDFSQGAQHWRYTTVDRPLTYQQQSYDYAAIKRGNLSESQDLTRNTLDLTVPDSLSVLDPFKPGPFLDTINVMLYEMSRADGSVTPRWLGEIGSVSFVENSQATIHCMPPMAATRATGLKRCWQKTCPLVIYSSGLGQCNANQQAMRVDATITSVAGSVVKAAAFATKPDNYFALGWIEWPDGLQMQRRFIIQHTGDTLYLLTPASMSVGTVVATYPGCDQSLDTCYTKFNNWINYGGQPWIPQKNPFGNDSIF